MAGDPRTIPMAVVRKLKDVLRYRSRHYPESTNTVCEVTGTLRIDVETGKILDVFLISGWENVDGEYLPTYSKLTAKNGLTGTIMTFGKFPELDDVTRNRMEQYIRRNDG